MGRDGDGAGTAEDEASAGSVSVACASVGGTVGTFCLTAMQTNGEYTTVSVPVVA